MDILKLYISLCCNLSLRSDFLFYVVTVLYLWLWLGLGAKITWLGLGKDHVLVENMSFDHHKHSWRCPKVSSQTPICVPSNIVGDVPTSCQIYPVTVLRSP